MPTDPVTLVSSKRDDTYASIRTFLLVDAACVLALIGATFSTRRTASREEETSARSVGPR